MFDTALTLALIVAAFFVALAVLVVFSYLDRRNASRLRGFSESERDSIVFIFENEALLDATPAARGLLESAPRHGSAWDQLAALLSPRFPRLNDRIHDLGEVGRMELKSTDLTSTIIAEWHDGVARITLSSVESDEAEPGLDHHAFLAMTHELESLRAAANHTPHPIWREDRGGTVTWCNAAYLELADGIAGASDLRAWPPARVFAPDVFAPDPGLGADVSDTGEPGGPGVQRLAIDLPGDERRRWFEVSVSALEGGERLFSAVPADKLVRAETALSEFITTLTKTFASLPIGLAIFDRQRELAVFNPALMDLTLLPAEFLIAKPTLSAFLDRLRQQRMIPEPRDYKSWRQQMADLVTAAQNGTYEETWALPTGQTYRVTGRPHPDGAVALLFEDISAEVSLSRRFRTEIEIGQSALDALPEAVAVFTPDGQLSITNHAYAALWGHDPATSPTEISVSDAVFAWQGQCAPSPVWDELRCFVSHSGAARERWSARLHLRDGRVISARVTPLARGATMVDFTAVPQPALAPAETSPPLSAGAGA